MLMPMRILVVVVILAAMVTADSGKSSSESSSTTPAVAIPPVATQSSASIRVEGEKRFRTNCGRCHMPPHKFPPRMMATIVRHMRVRALITDEDMRYILAYMTQ
jgi:mono/diheme cytochrome c family protein